MPSKSRIPQRNKRQQEAKTRQQQREAERREQKQREQEQNETGGEDSSPPPQPRSKRTRITARRARATQESDQEDVTQQQQRQPTERELELIEAYWVQLQQLQPEAQQDHKAPTSPAQRREQIPESPIPVPPFAVAAPPAAEDDAQATADAQAAPRHFVQAVARATAQEDLAQDPPLRTAPAPAIDTRQATGIRPSPLLLPQSNSTSLEERQMQASNFYSHERNQVLPARGMPESKDSTQPVSLCLSTSEAGRAALQAAAHQIQAYSRSNPLVAPQQVLTAALGQQWLTVLPGFVRPTHQADLDYLTRLVVPATYVPGNQGTQASRPLPLQTGPPSLIHATYGLKTDYIQQTSWTSFYKTAWDPRTDCAVEVFLEDARDRTKRLTEEDQWAAIETKVANGVRMKMREIAEKHPTVQERWSKLVGSYSGQTPSFEDRIRQELVSLKTRTVDRAKLEVEQILSSVRTKMTVEEGTQRALLMIFADQYQLSETERGLELPELMVTLRQHQSVERAINRSKGVPPAQESKHVRSSMKAKHTAATSDDEGDSKEIRNVRIQDQDTAGRPPPQRTFQQQRASSPRAPQRPARFNPRQEASQAHSASRQPMQTNFYTPPGRGQPLITCYKCGARGHTARDCYTRMGPKCSYCGISSHDAFHCRKRQADAEQQLADEATPATPATPVAPVVVCRKCHQPGHLAGDCRNAPADRFFGQPPARGRGRRGYRGRSFRLKERAAWTNTGSKLYSVGMAILFALCVSVNPVMGPLKCTRANGTVYNLWRNAAVLLTAIITLTLSATLLILLLHSSATYDHNNDSPRFVSQLPIVPQPRSPARSLALRYFRLRSNGRSEPPATRDRTREDSLFFDAQLMEGNVTMDLTVVLDTGGSMTLLPLKLERQLPPPTAADTKPGVDLETFDEHTVSVIRMRRLTLLFRPDNGRTTVRVRLWAGVVDIDDDTILLDKATLAAMEVELKVLPNRASTLHFAQARPHHPGILRETKHAVPRLSPAAQDGLQLTVAAPAATATASTPATTAMKHAGQPFTRTALAMRESTATTPADWLTCNVIFDTGAEISVCGQALASRLNLSCYDSDIKSMHSISGHLNTPLGETIASLYLRNSNDRNPTRCQLAIVKRMENDTILLGLAGQRTYHAVYLLTKHERSITLGLSIYRDSTDHPLPDVELSVTTTRDYQLRHTTAAYPAASRARVAPLTAVTDHSTGRSDPTLLSGLGRRFLTHRNTDWTALGTPESRDSLLNALRAEDGTELRHTVRSGDGRLVPTVQHAQSVMQPGPTTRTIVCGEGGRVGVRQSDMNEATSLLLNVYTRRALEKTKGGRTPRKQSTLERTSTTSRSTTIAVATTPTTTLLTEEDAKAATTTATAPTANLPTEEDAEAATTTSTRPTATLKSLAWEAYLIAHPVEADPKLQLTPQAWTGPMQQFEGKVKWPTCRTLVHAVRRRSDDVQGKHFLVLLHRKHAAWTDIIDSLVQLPKVIPLSWQKTPQPRILLLVTLGPRDRARAFRQSLREDIDTLVLKCLPKVGDFPRTAEPALHALMAELKWHQQHDTDPTSTFPTAPAKEWGEARDIEWEQFTDLVEGLGEPLEGLHDGHQQHPLQPAPSTTSQIRASRLSRTTPASSTAAATSPATQPSPDNVNEALWTTMATRVNTDLSPSQRAAINRALRQYRLTPTTTELGQAGDVEHAIDLINDNMYDIKAYRHAHTELERNFLSLTVKDLLYKGVIRESKSRFASPVVLALKKNDAGEPADIRVCVDYRKLNDATVTAQFPIPLIGSLIARLQRAAIFTILDLKTGYWQIPIRETDRWKTAFVTPDGLFEWIVMPFGLKNAPATFQAYMMRVINEDFKDFTSVYLDDILIYSANIEDHERHLAAVLSRLSQFHLIIKPEKCAFATTKLKYLGLIISSGKTEMDPAKIKALKDYPEPNTQKQLRRFLGMVNYHNTFIKDITSLTGPLSAQLTKKGTKLEWNEQHQHCFQALKTAMVNASALVQPDLKEKFWIETDASRTGVGAVLRQRAGVVAYAARTLNKAERNYATREQECLAIIFSLLKFRQYLRGSEFEVFTDHQPLVHLRHNPTNSARIERWLIIMNDYHFKITWKRGEANPAADALSRMTKSKTSKNRGPSRQDSS